MTFDELLELPLDKLESLSDEELRALLSPYIAGARPSDRPLTPKEVSRPEPRAKSQAKPKFSLAKAQEILALYERSKT